MPTVILPTKSVLKEYTITPFQFLKDSEVESWLTTSNKYDFLTKLMTAWRTGADNFTYYLTNYNDILYLRTVLTDSDYGYKYTVTSPIGYKRVDTGNVSIIKYVETETATDVEAVRWSINVSWA